MKKYIDILFYIVLAYTTLYSAIWLHELGHSIAYHYFGCKTNLFHLHVPVHFANASPNPIDEICANALANWQQFYVSMAGIAMNLILALGVGLLWSNRTINNKWVFFWCLFFLVSNLTEAATYLTISNIKLSGDLVGVHQYNPLLRIPLFFLGLLLIAAMAFTINHTPKYWRISTVIFIFSTAFSMSIMRFLFT